VFYTQDDENLNLQVDPRTGVAISPSADKSASK
jgi:hypothetical protein